ncbi:hypothetical protein R1sor_015718 [Riccia sorocarpa]|uniref:Uncharacterized protein n=1 Tax=Riccia sorocarpa TaxID=122646 RepID=A0ABD3HGY6_9MARC
MASVSSKAVHTLIQQLDVTVVQAKKDAESTNSVGDCYAALLLENLGIDNWITILHTFMTGGEDATLSLVRQLHEDLPALLETDGEEEGRVSELAKIIGKTLFWIDLEKSVIPEEVIPTPDSCSGDVPAQVKMVERDRNDEDRRTGLNKTLQLDLAADNSDAELREDENHRKQVDPEPAAARMDREGVNGGDTTTNEQVHDFPEFMSLFGEITSGSMEEWMIPPIPPPETHKSRNADHLNE